MSRRYTAQGGDHGRKVDNWGLLHIPQEGVEVLAGLPPVRLYIEKLVNRKKLRTKTLMSLHPLLAAMPNQQAYNHLAPCIALQHKQMETDHTRKRHY